MTCLRLGVVLCVFAAGWTVGRAQGNQADFRMMLDMPMGTGTVTCERGCLLQGGHDEGNSGNIPAKTYTFSCAAPDGRRCRAWINGWKDKE